MQLPGLIKLANLSLRKNMMWKQIQSQNHKRCKISMFNNSIFDDLWPWCKLPPQVIWQFTKTSGLSVLNSTVLSLLPLCTQMLLKLVLWAKEHNCCLLVSTRRYICVPDCALPPLGRWKRLVSLFFFDYRTKKLACLGCTSCPTLQV